MVVPWQIERFRYISTTSPPSKGKRGLVVFFDWDMINWTYHHVNPNGEVVLFPELARIKTLRVFHKFPWWRSKGCLSACACSPVPKFLPVYNHNRALAKELWPDRERPLAHPLACLKMFECAHALLTFLPHSSLHRTESIALSKVWRALSRSRTLCSCSLGEMLEEKATWGTVCALVSVWECQRPFGVAAASSVDLFFRWTGLNGWKRRLLGWFCGACQCSNSCSGTA